MAGEEKETKQLVVKAIGEDNWIKITNVLDPLGNKWKNKVIDVIKYMPKQVDNQ